MFAKSPQYDWAARSPKIEIHQQRYSCWCEIQCNYSSSSASSYFRPSPSVLVEEAVAGQMAQRAMGVTETRGEPLGPSTSNYAVGVSANRLVWSWHVIAHAAEPLSYTACRGAPDFTTSVARSPSALTSHSHRCLGVFTHGGPFSVEHGTSWDRCVDVYRLVVRACQGQNEGVSALA